MKRKTLLFSLILAMVIISLALCGADAPDGNISMDEDDFVELVVDAPLSLHYLESVYSLKAVNQMVGNEGEDGFAEVLYNANDEAEYVLATAEEGGYAIFHRMTGALMEAGEFGASPYAGQSGKKYYFGPSNYAVKDVNDVTTDIMRGGVMTTEQITTMHQYMAEKRALVVDRSETKSYANMLSALQTANTAEQQGEASVMSAVSGDWKTNPFANRVSISDFTNVANSYIFEYSYGKQSFGHNSHGSCGVVALVLLMKYYDITVAPGLIPSTVDDLPQTWIEECLFAPEIPHYNDPTREYYSCAIESGDSVYESLHKYLIALSNETEFPSTSAGRARAVYYYNLILPDCTSFGVAGVSKQNIEESFNEIKTMIDNDTPVKMGINYRETDEQEETSSHAIVAYGYYDNGENGKYYRTPFGWDGCSSIVVPHIFANNYYERLYMGDNFYHTGYNSCVYENCFSKNKHIAMPQGNSHVCSCDEVEEHVGIGAMEIWANYANYNANNKINDLYNLSNVRNEYGHFNACSECVTFILGIDISHPTGWFEDYESLFDFVMDSNLWSISMSPHTRGTVSSSNFKCMSTCIDCGYSYEIPHVGSFTYIGKINYHITTCTNCGGSYQENHAYAIGITGCVLCGYGAGLGGGIIKSI